MNDKMLFLQIETESPIEPGSSRQWSRRKLVSSHLVGQLAGRDCLSDVWFADSFLAIDPGVVVIAITDVVVGLRVLSGEVFTQGGLPRELGLAPGARNLSVVRRRRCG